MRRLKTLPIPHVLHEFNGIVETRIQWDDEKIQMRGPVIRTQLGDYDVPPRVIVQPLTPQATENGPAWVWDWESDGGNGLWVVFDATRHLIPKSKALPEVGAKSLDLSAKVVVELNDDVAPAYVDPPEADEDEPSESVVDEEDEDDDVTAG